jgi:hypothetical protein
VPLATIGNDLTDGGWTMSDPQLSKIYYQTVAENLDHIVFWEGGITSADDFIDFCKRKNIVMTFMCLGGEIIGYAWLAGIASNYAFGHFCVFRSMWGKKTKEVGKLVLDYWMSFPGNDSGRFPLFDVIIGVMPKFNVRAHAFAAAIGLTKLGTIPGMFRNIQRDREDAVIYYLSRTDHG